MTGSRKGLGALACGIVLVLVLIIPPVAADTMIREDATNRIGEDYTSLGLGTPGYDGTAESCSANCLDQPSCNAATFVAWDQSCWLKEIVPPATAESGMTSFVRQKSSPAVTITTGAGDTMIREDATNRLGEDYTSLGLGTPGYDGTAESCSANCLDQPSCNAATFVAWDQTCWLKEIVPPATAESGMTSFIRQKSSLAVTTTTGAAPTVSGTTPPVSGVPGGIKTPGFECVVAILGCLGVLVVRRSMR